MIRIVAEGIMCAQTTSADTVARNKAAVERSFNAWRDGIGSPFDLLDEAASWTIVGRSVAAKTYASREAFMREVIRPFNARMSSPLRPEIRQLYAWRCGHCVLRRAWNCSGREAVRKHVRVVSHDAR
jgi:hypothetical protein